MAEILLTKTRADAVLHAYSMLIVRYPSPEALAASDPVALETSIRYLGLAAKRTKNLRELARALVEQGVEVLGDPTLSISLPGLWRYGSRAVACFAFGKRVGIVDANVRRVLTRVFSLRHGKGERVHALADAIAAASKDPVEANYGLLDVGALVCKRTPRCTECPLAEMCKYAEARRIA